MSKTVSKRAIVYIDGFNLYHGLRGKDWQRYYWLNLKKFAESIIPVGNELVITKYFTSRVKGFGDDPDKPVRQAKYLDAVKTLEPDVLIYWGRYQAFQSHCRHCDRGIFCFNCGRPHIKPNEKKTDVNIATAMLVDSFEDKCDTQILVSGDSDYENMLKELRRLFSEKELIIVFPPMRKNNRLIGKNKCTSYFVIEEETLKNNQFENPVTYILKGEKILIDKPVEWS